MYYYGKTMQLHVLICTEGYMRILSLNDDDVDYYNINDTGGGNDYVR